MARKFAKLQRIDNNREITPDTDYEFLYQLQSALLLALREQGTVAPILAGDLESEVFSKAMLDSLTVYKDKHMELKLRGLPQVFQFAKIAFPKGEGFFPLSHGLQPCQLPQRGSQGNGSVISAIIIDSRPEM